MRKALVALVLLVCSGCDGFYVTSYSTPVYHEHKHVQYCDDSEPYYEPAEEYHLYYDYYGNYEGECGVWYLGYGEWEEWCLWHDSCGWEFVDHWHY
jgi:hypothetical protein